MYAKSSDLIVGLEIFFLILVFQMDSRKPLPLTPAQFTKQKVKKPIAKPKLAVSPVSPIKPKSDSLFSASAASMSPVLNKSPTKSPEKAKSDQLNQQKWNFVEFFKSIITFLYLLITDFSLARVKHMFISIFNFIFGPIIRKIKGNSTFMLVVAVIACFCSLGFIMDAVKTTIDSTNTTGPNRM